MLGTGTITSSKVWKGKLDFFALSVWASKEQPKSIIGKLELRKARNSFLYLLKGLLKMGLEMRSTRATQCVVHRPAVAASPGSLLEMHNLERVALKHIHYHM